jgi:hypothetical protein
VTLLLQCAASRSFTAVYRAEQLNQLKIKAPNGEAAKRLDQLEEGNR